MINISTSNKRRSDDGNSIKPSRVDAMDIRPMTSLRPASEIKVSRRAIDREEVQESDIGVVPCTDSGLTETVDVI